MAQDSLEIVVRYEGSREMTMPKLSTFEVLEVLQLPRCMIGTYENSRPMFQFVAVPDFESKFSTLLPNSCLN